MEQHGIGRSSSTTNLGQHVRALRQENLNQVLHHRGVVTGVPARDFPVNHVGVLRQFAWFGGHCRRMCGFFGDECSSSGSARLSGNGGNRPIQRVGIERLGDIVVHPDLKAVFAISFHGFGSHGDNANSPTGGSCFAAGIRFFSADRRRRVIAVHFRHLHVHQNHIERFASPQINSLPSIVGNPCLMTPSAQEPCRNFLIDPAVLGQQDTPWSDARESFLRDGVFNGEGDTEFVEHGIQ